jgi:hypothetical protein
MAGLVPAIHALQHADMRSAFVYIMTNHRNGVLYVGVTNDIIVAHGSIVRASSRGSRSAMG